MSTHTLGIDLHKRTSTWKLLDSNRKVVCTKVVDCQIKDIEQALKSLPVTCVGLPVAIEPVCGWRWVTKFLEEKGCDNHITNPFKLRLIADSKQKTDDADAKVLAEFLSLGYLPESWKAPDEVERWRQLVRVRTSLVQGRTRVKNQINSLLTAEYPRVAKQKLPDDTKFKELHSLIEEYTIHIHTFDKEITEIVKSNHICQLFLSLPSVGPITALTIMAEVGDFTRFKDASHLASFAGLVPSQRSSGDTVRYGHIVKTGSKLLRSTLVETALRFREHHDAHLNDFLVRVQKQRGKMRGRVALAHKLLTIMYAMVKKDMMFITSCDITKSGDLV